MSKRDRVAIVISVLVLILGCIILYEIGLSLFGALVIIGIILIIYWGYRFIKNDISFLGGNDDKSQ